MAREGFRPGPGSPIDGKHSTPHPHAVGCGHFQRVGGWRTLSLIVGETTENRAFTVGVDGKGGLQTPGRFFPRRPSDPDERLRFCGTSISVMDFRTSLQTNLDDDTVTVLLGVMAGEGSHEAAGSPFAAGARSLWRQMAIGDFNRDTNPDLAVIIPYERDVPALTKWVLLCWCGDGKREVRFFSLSTPFTRVVAASGPNGIATRLYLNGDGFPDIVRALRGKPDSS